MQPTMSSELIFERSIARTAGLLGWSIAITGMSYFCLTRGILNFAYEAWWLGIILGPLAEALQGATSMPGFRMAAMVLSCSYLVGLVALIWAPETVDQPLPEEQRAVLH